MMLLSKISIIALLSMVLFAVPSIYANGKSSTGPHFNYGGVYVTPYGGHHYQLTVRKRGHYRYRSRHRYRQPHYYRNYYRYRYPYRYRQYYYYRYRDPYSYRYYYYRYPYHYRGYYRYRHYNW